MNFRGIPFEELDVEKSAQGRQEYRALKGRGVPIILVGNQRMNGYDRRGWKGCCAPPAIERQAPNFKHQVPNGRR